MIDALLADFRKTDCDRIIAIGGGAVIDMAKILVLAGDYSAEEIFGRKVPLKRAKTLMQYQLRVVRVLRSRMYQSQNLQSCIPRWGLLSTRFMQTVRY